MYYIINNRITEREELDPRFYNYRQLTQEEIDFHLLNPNASVSEVLNLTLNPVYEPDIEDVRANAIATVKNQAKELLEPTDYKVLRHRDQLELDIATTLTSEEFHQLLLDRQAIRDESNTKEAAILGAETIEEIEEIAFGSARSPEGAQL